jgi:hypothetical protein
MLSDTGITFAGFTFSSSQLLIAGVALLFVGLLLAMARGRRIALQRSIVTDDVANQLGRIAFALEQLANEASTRRIMEQNQRSNVTLPPAAIGEEPNSAPFSIFGRKL